jgi:hypothetical protein
VINLGAKYHLGRTHGIVLSQIQLQFETAALVRGFRRPLDLHEEMPEIIRVRLNFYTNH